ncbi:hypothetical protein [Paenibacillus lemnae]|uniref:Uncharacterized protein n=1 Tax=Paenibacillus lemnae TaxID=1330551 RepID=A0A848MAN7_PAELE|nr:hypothetical protein [Paenibacillus lemnae]NMO97013.1 hypothetical protein [Paenibacillus lemnae]
MSAYPSHQVVYQCDQHMAHTMKEQKAKMQQALQPAINRKVRVHTMDDEVLEGVILGYDKNFIYLSMEQTSPRAFFPYPGYYPPRPPFYPSNVILPLALFDLLTLTLLL